MNKKEIALAIVGATRFVHRFNYIVFSLLLCVTALAFIGSLRHGDAFGSVSALFAALFSVFMLCLTHLGKYLCLGFAEHLSEGSVAEAYTSSSEGQKSV